MCIRDRYEGHVDYAYGTQRTYEAVVGLITFQTYKSGSLAGCALPGSIFAIAFYTRICVT